MPKSKSKLIGYHAPVYSPYGDGVVGTVYHPCPVEGSPDWLASIIEATLALPADSVFVHSDAPGHVDISLSKGVQLDKIEDECNVLLGKILPLGVCYNYSDGDAILTITLDGMIHES